MALPGVEWDENKNVINKAIHHIDFEDAQYIFSDSNRLERIDQSSGNISGEERLQTLGMVRKALFVVYTEDCPPSSPEALREFAQLAAERDRRKKKKSVTIRISLDVLENYKTMGNGYTGIMADVLKYAINNPNVLSEAIK